MTSGRLKLTPGPLKNTLAHDEAFLPIDRAALPMTASAPAGRIGNTIRRLRFEHGEMTQAALAGLVGVTRQAIIAIEGGRYAPSLELAFRIAAAFGRPLEDVFVYRPG